jgi:type I restriction enzyme R subunit
MQKALSEYASGSDGKYFPAKDIDQLIDNIDQCIAEIDQFLLPIGVCLDKIMEETDTLNQIELYRKAYNKILEKDEWKDRFKVLSNLLNNLYDASKPEIFERGWDNDKFAPILYLIGLFYNQIDDEKLARAKAKMAEVLDRSVTAAEADDKNQYVIHEGKVIDVSKLDVESIKKVIDTSPYKALEIEDLRAYIEKVLEQMINKNCTRIKFSERYKGIIDRYNAGGSENEDYYEKLLELIESLKKEQGRATEMDLMEEELEIYDLLIKDRKLTKSEEQRVKLAAKNLYKKLIEEKEKVMVVDWYKDEQPKQKVMDIIMGSLNNDLPESYDRDVFSNKTNLLMNHFIDMAVQGYGWVA